MSSVVKGTWDFGVTRICVKIHALSLINSENLDKIFNLYEVHFSYLYISEN